MNLSFWLMKKLPPCGRRLLDQGCLLVLAGKASDGVQMIISGIAAVFAIALEFGSEQLIFPLRAHGRPHLRWVDRALFIWLYRRCPRILNAITVVRPETILRWHRMGFAAYWRWRSRSPGGRPRIAKEVRDLIRRMSLENPLWGATKIHGELLKLGIRVAQSTVSTYMVPRRDRPLQTWKTFVRNHMEGIAAIDLFVVPTIAFEQLFAFLVLGLDQRQLLWFAVTRNPTAEWLARQITEAFPWDSAPKYATMTKHLAPRSRLASGRWGSGTEPHRFDRHGRTDTSNA